MGLVLVKPPTVEPVTLAELKSHLRLDSTDEDTLLTSLVSIARQAVEQASGQRLLAQDWRLVLDCWPSGGIVRLPLAPMRAVTAIRVFGADGSATALVSANWRLDASQEPARLAVSSPPAPGRRFAGIEIDVTAGYGATPGDVPEPLRQAVRLWAARLYEERGDGVARDPPAEIAALIAPYRPARL